MSRLFYTKAYCVLYITDDIMIPIAAATMVFDICGSSKDFFMQSPYNLYDLYRSCELCPRQCRTDRTACKIGVCGMTADLYAARAALHYWEEPCISGSRGSGTVFFSGCSLRCVFCQNREISHNKIGFPISPKRLADIFLELQDIKHANNINLVTPSHYIPHIVSALERARTHGLSIPVVYNSSGYESVNSLRMLDGLVDVYLPDFKYVSQELSLKYSGVADYFNVASLAVHEMFRQVGEPVFEEDGAVIEVGMMKKGVIVRHLILPTCTDDSREVIAYLFSHFKHNIYISIMNQYTPLPHSSLPVELSRGITDAEYEKVVGFARRMGIRNGFIQESGTVAESFVPLFDGEGIVR